MGTRCIAAKGTPTLMVRSPTSKMSEACCKRCWQLRTSHGWKSTDLATSLRNCEDRWRTSNPSSSLWKWDFGVSCHTGGEYEDERPTAPAVELPIARGFRFTHSGR